jgi:hypothetical protein
VHWLAHSRHLDGRDGAVWVGQAAQAEAAEAARAAHAAEVGRRRAALVVVTRTLAQERARADELAVPRRARPCLTRTGAHLSYTHACAPL